MSMLSHGWKCNPMDENIYDFYSCGIIGVIVHGHVINIYQVSIEIRDIYIGIKIEKYRNFHKNIRIFTKI